MLLLLSLVLLTSSPSQSLPWASLRSAGSTGNSVQSSNATTTTTTTSSTTTTTTTTTLRPAPSDNDVDVGEPLVSRCVWAIVACCRPGSNHIRYNCFEGLGCHGAFWGTSPCSTHITTSALQAALDYYH